VGRAVDEELRPLLAGPVRWESGGVTVDLGDREVRVGGDAAALRAILGGCDGRTPVAALAVQHGEATRALLADLLAQGALVDAGDAWRTLHRQSSVGTALGRPVTEEELAGLERGAFAPAPPAGDPVPLAPAPSAVGAAAERRRSTLPDRPGAPVSFAALSAVLAAAYGVEGEGRERSGTVPSAGALYPLAIHVALRAPLGPLETGLHWQDPRARALRRLGPADDVEALFVPEPSCRALLRRGQPVAFVSADLARPARKYGPRGYRYALIEAGAALQCASLVAQELDVPIRAIGGIDDGAVHRFLRLPDTAVPLLALLIGG